MLGTVFLYTSTSISIHIHVYIIILVCIYIYIYTYLFGRKDIHEPSNSGVPWLCTKTKHKILAYHSFVVSMLLVRVRKYIIQVY
jgi:hypothetical protein